MFIIRCLRCCTFSPQGWKYFWPLRFSHRLLNRSLVQIMLNACSWKLVKFQAVVGTIESVYVLPFLLRWSNFYCCLAPLCTAPPCWGAVLTGARQQGCWGIGQQVGKFGGGGGRGLWGGLEGGDREGGRGCWGTVLTGARQQGDREGPITGLNFFN